MSSSARTVLKKNLEENHSSAPWKRQSAQLSFWSLGLSLSPDLV